MAVYTKINKKDISYINKKFDDVPTAIKECNQNDGCVGVKLFNHDGGDDKAMVCKSFDKMTSISVTGTTYEKREEKSSDEDDGKSNEEIYVIDSK